MKGTPTDTCLVRKTGVPCTIGHALFGAGFGGNSYYCPGSHALSPTTEPTNPLWHDETGDHELPSIGPRLREARAGLPLLRVLRLPQRGAKSCPRVVPVAHTTVLKPPFEHLISPPLSTKKSHFKYVLRKVLKPLCGSTYSMEETCSGSCTSYGFHTPPGARWYEPGMYLSSKTYLVQ